MSFSEKVSKALALLIIITSYSATQHVYWVITNVEFYQTRAGAYWIAGVIPYFIVIAGCILLLLGKRYAHALVLVGGILSFFGSSWSYMPLFPLLSSDPKEQIVLVYAGNVLVLAILAWSALQQRRADQQSKS